MKMILILERVLRINFLFLLFFLENFENEISEIEKQIYTVFQITEKDFTYACEELYKNEK